MSSGGKSTAAVRSVQLDFLRGVAILLVLFRHPPRMPEEAGALGPLADALHRFGWTGVDLFFVLSGFLIGGLLFKELLSRGRIDVRRFLLRRGWKIWPPYFALLVVAFAMVARKEGAAGAARALAPNLLHVQNYLGTPFGHTWSLAVEEHFYLALPLVLLLLARPRRQAAPEAEVEGESGYGPPSALRLLPLLVGALAVACLAMRLALPAPWEMLTHLTPTHLRIDSLAFGVLLAYFAQFHAGAFGSLARRRGLLLGAGLVLLAPLLVLPPETRFGWSFGYTLAFVGYGCILVSVVLTPLGEGPVGRALASRPARALALVGFYSYSVYLWHIPFVYAPLIKLAPALPHGRWAGAWWACVMFLYVAGAFAAGTLMAWLIERPALALRDRLFPTKVPGQLAVPAPALSGGFLVKGLAVSPAPEIEGTPDIEGTPEIEGA